MALYPLDHILSSLRKGKGWQTQNQFAQLVNSWPGVVGPMVAQHTRPVKIERQVLHIATSSAVWAQNLRFERHHILQKLAALDFAGLRDIYFSTNHWAHLSDPALLSETVWQQQVWADHPCRLPELPPALRTAPSSPQTDALQAFQQWSLRQQQRLSQLPRCPQCGCPTPPKELKRWQCCAFCITRTW